MISAVGIDEGAVSNGTDRYDELTCEGEKPLTTLVVLLSEVLESDIDAEGRDSGVSDLASALLGCAVASTCGFCGGRGGEKLLMLRVIGSRCFFSLMVMTIFSRSSGVMCRSRPLLRLLTESFR